MKYNLFLCWRYSDPLNDIFSDIYPATYMGYITIYYIITLGLLLLLHYFYPFSSATHQGLGCWWSRLARAQGGAPGSGGECGVSFWLSSNSALRRFVRKHYNCTVITLYGVHCNMENSWNEYEEYLTCHDMS